MAQYCHASHEVYHEGVAQRAHNLSPVPFGAAKATKESSYHCSDTASQTPGGLPGAGAWVLYALPRVAAASPRREVAVLPTADEKATVPFT